MVNTYSGSKASDNTENSTRFEFIMRSMFGKKVRGVDSSMNGEWIDVTLYRGKVYFDDAECMHC